MSLEQAIHERWGSDALLASLLPSERLSTGVPRGATTLPYVVLARRESQAVARTSSGTCLERVALRFSIYAAELDQGKEIVAAVTQGFDRVDFPLDDGYALNMQRAAESESPLDDGSWRLELEFIVTLRRDP